MFKGLGDLASMMQQAQQVGERIRASEQSLHDQTFVGTSGGDMIRAEVSGKGELVRLSIDPQLVTADNREVIEDLVPAAVNQALSKMQEARLHALQQVLPNTGIPGMPEMLSRLFQKH